MTNDDPKCPLYKVGRFDTRLIPGGVEEWLNLSASMGYRLKFSSVFHQQPRSRNQDPRPELSSWLMLILERSETAPKLSQDSATENTDQNPEATLAALIQVDDLAGIKKRLYSLVFNQSLNRSHLESVLKYEAIHQDKDKLAELLVNYVNKDFLGQESSKRLTGEISLFLEAVKRKLTLTVRAWLLREPECLKHQAFPESGETAFGLAVDNIDPHMIEILFEFCLKNNKLDIMDKPNVYGFTPLGKALQKRDEKPDDKDLPRIIEIMESHGARSERWSIDEMRPFYSDVQLFQMVDEFNKDIRRGLI